ncbi:helix-turn-helix transcriptional regulator [Candidatus Williamhamiltonella defendens]|uniref:helix-turn-helix transcriptional regulator n=1 Tax=Candidatus Williamhamiltonella defendens TaxID=138072 RepID=UPI00158250A2|nr:LuxR C-terminal-related transcriptional regulator [Candidatus Hamiltonella defensa]
MMKAFDIKEIKFYQEIFEELSPAEIKVLSLYCSGLQCNKISLLLNMSLSTVNSHLNNARKKYELNNYSELRALFHFLINNHLINSFFCNCCKLKKLTQLPKIAKQPNC